MRLLDLVTLSLRGQEETGIENGRHRSGLANFSETLRDLDFRLRALHQDTYLGDLDGIVGFKRSRMALGVWDDSPPPQSRRKHNEAERVDVTVEVWA